ncbi:hypothetical protein GRJ2_000371100 [Grus japonensis]|uniref:Uncharacterized protein n=1 Tax=Grus japonensis TaxID=30415 RepID=A0ABC9W0Q4_GRUJA
MEDPTPEQGEAPEGGCGLWEAHAGASCWQGLRTRGERSPRQSRFAGRTCDPVGDPMLEQSAPEGLHPVGETTLEQFVKDCSPWERPTLEQIVKDCLPWEGLHAGAGEQ